MFVGGTYRGVMEEGEEAASREGPATPDVFVMEAAALGMMSLHSKA